jgi:hypothetical protein
MLWSNTRSLCRASWRQDAIRFVALLDPLTRRPAIRRAITGRQDDGWYQVGEIVVE